MAKCTATCTLLYSDVYLTVQQNVTECTAVSDCSTAMSTKYALTCSHGLPIASVLPSISAVPNLTLPSYKIHINTIVTSANVSSKDSFRFRESDKMVWLISYF